MLVRVFGGRELSAFGRECSSTHICVGHKTDSLFCCLLYRLPRIQQGKIRSCGPHGRQIAVVRTVLIPGFSGIIHCARIVPIAYVQHHAHRRSAQLQKIARAVGRRVHGKGATTGFERSDIQLLLLCFIHYPREGMFTEVVVQLAPSPLAGVRPLQRFHLCVGCGESGEQQLVSLLRGGMLQPLQ